MITIEDLHRIIGRIRTSSNTPSDVDELVRIITVAGPGRLQLGKYNVQITEGSDVQIGDRNTRALMPSPFKSS
jgi:hypothetical protein